MSTSRLEALTAWYKSLSANHVSVPVMISGDASFRKFYRVDEGILMDAPPATEKNREFVELSALYLSNGIRVPKVLSVDYEHGFLLVDDLGNETMSKHMNAEESMPLCLRAVKLLARLAGAGASGLPPFDREFMLREIDIGTEWYFRKAQGVTFTSDDAKIVKDAAEIMISNNLSLPQVFMHRDFHCRNIMLSGDGLALVDFQDSVLGPLTYDFASLIFDCYRDFSEEDRTFLIKAFMDEVRKTGVLGDSVDFDEFRRAVYITALQRLYKCVGIFSRLYFRDGKNGYLQYIPRVIHNIRMICGMYPELSDLAGLFEKYGRHNPDFADLVNSCSSFKAS